MKKPIPYTTAKKNTQVKAPGDDSNYGPSPTAHQVPHAKGRPPQGKITIGRKGNENLSTSTSHGKNNTPKVKNQSTC